MARPQRLSSIEYTFSLVAWIGMSWLGGVGDGVLTGQPPVAHRGHHLEVGGERHGRHLEADLVVALAGAPVGDGVGAVEPGPTSTWCLTISGRDSADTNG
jgi:hypothetical protein